MDDGMGKILEAFFKGEIDIDGGRTPRQQELGREVKGFHEDLEKRLDNGDKELLEDLVDTMLDEGACYGEKMFERGFQLGILMAAETFLERDSFLTEQEE